MMAVFDEPSQPSVDEVLDQMLGPE